MPSDVEGFQPPTVLSSAAALTAWASTIAKAPASSAGGGGSAAAAAAGTPMSIRRHATRCCTKRGQATMMPAAALTAAAVAATPSAGMVGSPRMVRITLMVATSSRRSSVITASALRHAASHPKRFSPVGSVSAWSSACSAGLPNVMGVSTNATAASLGFRAGGRGG